MRQDLKYAAYAVHLGYTLKEVGGCSIEKTTFSSGIPLGELSFYKGNVLVWNTQRGWRVARREETGGIPRPVEKGFHKSLRIALERGVSHD